MAIAQQPLYEAFLDYLVEKASPEEILAFRLPSESIERESYLLDKQREAEITPDEARELSQLLEVEALISALQARALHALDVVANFKQGWKEALTGQTHPVSELWDDVNNELDE